MTVQIATLANGLRVVSDPVDHVETASLGLWVDVGARCESAETNGISHLLEHMAFKGTERRSARDIAEEIEAVGGHLNAYTSRETTAYYAKVMKEDVPLALDLLADILQHSTFDEEELERERTVVIQEIAQVNDTPDDLVFERFQETVYPDQPIGRSILGPPEQVGRYTRDALAAYMEAHYRAQRMVLVGSGRDRARGAGRLRPRPRSPRCPTAAGGGAGGRGLRRRRLPHDARAGAGAPGGGLRRHRLRRRRLLHAPGAVDAAGGRHVVAPLPGGARAPGPRLFGFHLLLQLRRRRRLRVYAGAGEGDLAELVPVMAGELVKACEAVGGDEVARARAQLKAGLLMSLESTQARAERLGRHMLLFGRPLPIAEMIERVDAIDAGRGGAVRAPHPAGRPAHGRSARPHRGAGEP